MNTHHTVQIGFILVLLVGVVLIPASQGQAVLSISTLYLPFVPRFEIPIIYTACNQSYVCDIWKIYRDGSPPIRLTNDVSGKAYDVAWSRDHSHIAFVSERDGNREIYIMDADGSNQIRLTNNTTADVLPAWSPDGTRIVFVKANWGSDYYGRICTINVNGTSESCLTPSGKRGFPAWSPDGQLIIYSLEDPATLGDIYVMNTDGSNQHAILSTPADELYPEWSPDGSRIIYAHYTYDSTEHIYIMNADGSNPVALPGYSNNLESSPAFSPDGKMIVYHVQVAGTNNYEIFVMNADGSNRVQLTMNTTYDYLPDW